METMAILYKDNFYVWTAMTNAYPKDFFLGCIEDQYGSFFDSESESKLQTRAGINHSSLIDIRYIEKGQVKTR